MNKVLFVMMAMLCFALHNQAQSLPYESQGNYPLSVIFKVRSLNAAVNLSADQQATMANFLVKQENSIAAAVSNGSTTPSQLKQLQVQLDTEFQSIFTSQQYSLYLSTRRQYPVNIDSLYRNYNTTTKH